MTGKDRGPSKRWLLVAFVGVVTLVGLYLGFRQDADSTHETTIDRDSASLPIVEAPPTTANAPAPATGQPSKPSPTNTTVPTGPIVGVATPAPAPIPQPDPAAEAFRAELDGYVRDGREPEFIAAVASALERQDYSATTRWNIYVLRFIGSDKAESVLHEALEIEVDKRFPDIDDRLSVVASAFDALEDLVGREERLDITGRYVTALEDAIVNATVPHVAIHAARIHLAHAENREEAERHLAELLGEERAWILDIEDRIPAPLKDEP